MNLVVKSTLFFFLLFMVGKVNATHIVGGEMSYVCLGNNQYKIILKVYRDCYNSQTQFDDPLNITIFKTANNAVYSTLQINNPQESTLQNNTGNICLTVPPNICVAEAIYTTTVSLPPITGGYTIVYQRCCRNGTIQNITNPNANGASYVAVIPDVSITCNNSPVFSNFPPTVICANQPLNFDHSAVDPDGDVLVYSLCTPFAGASQTTPNPNTASAPPFPLVTYTGSYSASNPLTASPGIAIDAITGMLTGTPTAIGQFVVGVCVQEYRNGVLIGVHYRDFQFNVTNCLQIVTAVLPATINACVGSTYTFANNSIGGTFYHWDFGVPNTSLDTSNLFSPSFTYTTPGTYTVTQVVNPGFSCESSTTSTLTVYPNPIASPSSNSPLCTGSILNLSATSVAGATYQWSGPNGFTSTNQNPVITNTTTLNSGSYTLTVSANGCNSINAGSSVNVIVYPIPPVPNISSNSPVCAGSNLQLTSNAIIGATYHWTGPNGFTSSLQNPLISITSANNAGTYSCYVSVNNCDGAISNTTVVINPIPTTPTISSNSPLCSTNTLNLTSNLIPGASYSWNGPNGFNSTNQNPSISNISTVNAGAYSLNINVLGCNSLSATTNVIIFQVPNAIASGNTSACIGQSISLYSTSFTNASYSWIGPNGFTSTLQNPTINNITGLSAGNYTVVATANGCVGNSSSITVSVNPIPAAPTISNNTPLCSGTTFNLTSSSASGASYTWSGPNNFSSSLQNPVINNVPFANAGTYTLFITVLGCNSPIVSTNAIINLSPQSIIQNNGPLCDGDNLQLNSNSISGATYSWIGPNSFISTIQNPSINNVSLNANGTYTLTMSLAGCIGQPTTTNIIVNPIPQVPIIASNSPICAGQAIIFSAQNVAGGTFSWTGVNSFSSASQNPTISNTTSNNAGNYQASVTVLGCTSAAANTSVIIKPVPAPPVISSNSPICSGNNINLQATSISGVTYQWSGVNLFSSTLQSPDITNADVNETGNYSATVSLNGCTSMSNSTLVTVYPIPNSDFSIATTSCVGLNNTITYIGNSSSSANYNWNFGSAIVSSGSGQGPYNVSWNTIGNYSVSLTVTENGCTSPVNNESTIVFTIPTSDFTINPSICQSDSAQIIYTGTGTTNSNFNWNFGSGIISNGSNQGSYWIKYNSTGNYTISLIVSENGCTSQLNTENISVNFTPTADFIISPTTICPNEKTTITYNGTGTSAGIYSWDFNDGIIITGNNAGPYSILYSNPHVDTITLIVTENNCISPKITKTIIIDSLPRVSFTVSDSLGCSPFNTSFTNLSSQGLVYEWNFGDDGLSNEENPSHTYSTGIYDVFLKVGTASGCKDSLSKNNYINVINNPIAFFKAKPDSSQIIELKDASYQFSNLSKYATRYTWFFGDGDTSSMISPTHIYKDTGSYTVSLIAYNEIGCSDTFELGIFKIVPDVNYFIPNTFTPNGDGINDVFQVYSASIIGLKIRVFDRLGEEVFNTSDLFGKWDGTYQGKKLNTGVFVYYAELQSITGITLYLKGDVTLLR